MGEGMSQKCRRNGEACHGGGRYATPDPANGHEMSERPVSRPFLTWREGAGVDTPQYESRRSNDDHLPDPESVIGHIFAGGCLSCAGQAQGNRTLQAASPHTIPQVTPPCGRSHYLPTKVSIAPSWVRL